MFKPQFSRAENNRNSFSSSFPSHVNTSFTEFVAEYSKCPSSDSRCNWIYRVKVVLLTLCSPTAYVSWMFFNYYIISCCFNVECIDRFPFLSAFAAQHNAERKITIWDTSSKTFEWLIRKNNSRVTSNQNFHLNDNIFFIID